MVSVNVRTTRVESLAELEALEPAWWDLCERASDREPVATPTWLLAWWRTFGDDTRRLRSLAIWDDDRLIGLAPLQERWVRHRGILPMRRLELLATGEDEAEEVCSDYVGVIAERGAEEVVAREVAEEIAQRASSWDELYFTQMDGESKVTIALEHALAPHGIIATERARGACPHILLPKAWDDYVKGLDSKSRYLVTRALRELDSWAGADGWKLRRATNAEELVEARDVLHRLHETRWTCDGHDGVFARDRFRTFHDEVMPKLLARGELDVVWLEVKGQPVAVLYNIVYDNKAYVYQSGRITHDVPKNLKIGIAMNCVAIRDYIDKGLREYDFLNGMSQYKRQMCAGNSRPIVTVRAPSPAPRGQTLELARRATERVVPIAKLLHRKVRNMRGHPPGDVPPPPGDHDGD